MFVIWERKLFLFWAWKIELGLEVFFLETTGVSKEGVQLVVIQVRYLITKTSPRPKTVTAHDLKQKPTIWSKGVLEI